VRTDTQTDKVLRLPADDRRTNSVLDRSGHGVLHRQHTRDTRPWKT